MADYICYLCLQARILIVEEAVDKGGQEPFRRARLLDNVRAELVCIMLISIYLYQGLGFIYLHLYRSKIYEIYTYMRTHLNPQP